MEENLISNQPIGNNSNKEENITFTEEQRYPLFTGSNFYYYNNLSIKPQELYSKIKIMKTKENTNVKVIHGFSFSLNFHNIDEWVKYNLIFILET